MAIKEVATNQDVVYAYENQAIGNDVTTGAIIDTAKMDNGIYFAAFLSAWTAGTAVMTIFEDSASDMGTATIVAAKNLIYTAPSLTTAATVEGAKGAKLGCFGTKRYLRVTMTGDVTADLSAFVIAIENPESRPTAQGGLAV